MDNLRGDAMGWGNAANTLIRQRLDALFNNSVGSSISILRGPMGVGKSTAVLDWLKRCAPETGSWGWINLTSLDAELVPNTSADLSEAASSSELQGLAEMRKAQILLHFERSTTSDSHLLVLDAFSARHESELSATLESLAVDYPERRFVIITHELLEMERRRSLSPVDIAVIPPQEFAFTDEEAKAYFAGTVLENFAQELNEESGGSVALLRLAKLRAETMKSPRSYGGTFLTSLGENLDPRKRTYGFHPDPEARASVDAIKAAVRRDVLLNVQNAGFDAEQLEFLATLSVPSFIDEQLVPLIYPKAQSHWLPDLEARGLIHRSTRNPEREYQINHVLRSALKEAYLAPSPERLRELNLCCARFELAQGSAFRALRFALDGADYGLASDVIRHHADEYLEGELGQRGAYLLDALPMTVLAKHPLLAISLAVAYSATGKFKFKTLELLALAAASAHTIARNAHPTDRLLLIMVESVAMRLSGLGDAAVRTARAGVRLYRAMTPEERDSIGRFEGSILVQFALSLHSGSIRDEAMEVVEYGVSADGKHGDGDRGNYAGTILAYFHALDGNIHKAKAQLQTSFPELWSKPETNAYFASPFRIASFFCAMEEQRFEDAQGWLDLLVIGVENNEFWPVIRLAESMLAIIRGETTGSLVRMQGFLTREHEQPIAQKTGRQMLDVASSLLSLASGDASNALRVTQKKSMGVETSSILQARIRLAQGDAAEALRLCTSAGNPVSPRSRFEQAVMVLAASLQNKKQNEVAGPMRVVAALSEEFGLSLALNFLPAPDLQNVLKEAQKMKIRLAVHGSAVSNIPGGLSLVVLSERELAVLTELVSTGSFAEIAERQFVSINTVKSQLRSVYRKLGVSERAAAIDVARIQGLIVSPEQQDRN